MYDENAMYDPYRLNKDSPQKGKQYNDYGSQGFVGEEPRFSTMGGPNARPPYSEFDSDPSGRPLPRDGGAGDTGAKSGLGVAVDAPIGHNNGQVSDTSAIAKPIKDSDLNPFSRSLNNDLNLDPYEIIRKRKKR